ncbi:hypothetical protein CEUSTIGMA_g1264.t1 [Chlamydomonas eustigma]|uniref:riboflavin kinase n=1 Tax=Chlamydomonas eustigma TaxID=1157962 RepID=A0A250WSL5_9CHLO|nr:hypothetical protein CEUSTIGMA_g1264.t1 [Chlamydomonas eustigma]|eukprot:GAX73813.1 hypothetical protein CEUSTIGMA_g1264.t1 [Chlamydomonas eustigma]
MRTCLSSHCAWLGSRALSSHAVFAFKVQRSMSAAAAPSDRSSHNLRQKGNFNNPDTLTFFTSPLPEDVQQRLQKIGSSVPELGPSSRVIDVGSGTGCLIPHFKDRGVQDILAVDLSEGMLAELSSRYCSTSRTLGNDPGVRTWCGDILDLPNYLGPVDAIFMNGVFGNLFSQRDALLKAALLLRPGGHVVVSHPMGRIWHNQLKLQDPDLVLHELPSSREALDKLIWDLPLKTVEFMDTEDLYLASLQVPPKYALKRGPLKLEGRVVKGYGRGSRQMGVPTANIDPKPLAGQLSGLPNGVYFGWAKLDVPPGWPSTDGYVHKMVMNIGRRPTVSAEGEDDVSVEVHMMHGFSQADFYGQHLKVVAIGFLRPEMKFPGGLSELIARIRADVAISKNQLDDSSLLQYQTLL